MPKIVFIEPNGTHKTVEAAVGQSVMQAAVQNGVHGIQADCAGSCACATCHVYVDEAWFNDLSPARRAELDMLEFALDVRTTSRLTCQIPVTDALDGLTVRVPDEQA